MIELAVRKKWQGGSAMRYFNTEGCCRPEEHYMVKLDERLEKIKRLYVDRKNTLLSTGEDSMAKQQH